MKHEKSYNREVKLSILALVATAALTLTGCSGHPATADTPAPELHTIEALNDHMSDQHDGRAHLTEDGKLTVAISSRASKRDDQAATLDVLQEVGESAHFDYTTLVVAADTPIGNWRYQYNAGTVANIADDDTPARDIWDHATTGTNNAY